MRRLIAIAAGVAAVATFVGACSVGPPGPGIAVDRAIAHVAALTKNGPRPGDTAASRAAAAYMTEQLASIGVDVERFDVGEVDLPAIDVPVAHRPGRRVHTTDPDLLVRFGPPGKALLVMAHYDTVPPSPGAVDNAVAVGVTLELARVLHDHPPPQPVLLAFTANEEIGLVGAEALAERRGGDVGFAIALDLVGGSGPLALNGASKLIGDAELGWLADAADRAGVELTAPLPHRVVSRWWPAIERADHGPFTRRGIRAVHFYDRGQDGESIDLAYHSAHDVLSRVDRASVAEIGRLVRALTDVAPPPHAGDGFWLPLASNVALPRWPLVAVELALVALALMLVRVRAVPGSRRGAGVLAAIACYTVATAALIALERWTAGEHPAPWLHAPLRAVLAEGLVLVGALGLATRVVARRWRWIGARRYLAIAVAVDLAIGIAWLATGAAELAWIWLVPAAALAVAPRIGRLAPLALVVALLPAALLLSPDQLREAAWNEFLPSGVPLGALLAVMIVPVLAGVSWWIRLRKPAQLGSIVLTLGCALAVAAGGVLMSAAVPMCKPREFIQFHLSCERISTWP